MKKVFLTIILTLNLLALESSDYDSISQASLNGKYYNLIQIIKCERDRANYGKFNEYGYWSGGLWCGQSGKEGYWVWLYPNWYIWASRGVVNRDYQIPKQASVNGKYSKLLQTLKCQKDRKNYGDFKEYGYWSGGNWCGKSAKAGYWVWVYPNWYVWSVKKK